jgi:hypothetical protein
MRRKRDTHVRYAEGRPHHLVSHIVSDQALVETLHFRVCEEIKSVVVLQQSMISSCRKIEQLGLHGITK